MKIFTIVCLLVCLVLTGCTDKETNADSETEVVSTEEFISSEEMPNIIEKTEYTEEEWKFQERDINNYFTSNHIDNLSPYEKKVLDEAVSELNLDANLITEFYTEGWGSYEDNTAKEYPCTITIVYDGKYMDYSTTSEDNLFWIITHTNKED